MNSNIRLQPLSDVDVIAIRQWPPYPERLHDLDYALRAGGWLDEFPASPRTYRFGAWHIDKLVGFSLLTDIADSAAEFYIALHPHAIGDGLGKMITEATLDIGFKQLGLHRIYLKVRDWHTRGKALYEHVGFKTFGSHTQNVNGKTVNFFDMEIFAAKSAAESR